MTNKILTRRGLKADMPTLSTGEQGYATDTRELYMGTGSGNVNMGGSHWYRGTAMSGTSTTANAYSYSACPEVKMDDIYMNTSNGNIYACTTAGKGTAAKWTYQGCIKGPQGATGATGAAGSDGEIDYKALIAFIGALFDELDCSTVSGGTWFSKYASTSYVGKTYYLPQAQDWYDTIRDIDETVNWNLYNKNGTSQMYIEQGETAIIKFVTSTKAYVLMKA